MRAACDVEENYQEFTTEITKHTKKNQDMVATDLPSAAEPQPNFLDTD
jgi:hypothetical protein